MTKKRENVIGILRHNFSLFLEFSFVDANVEVLSMCKEVEMTIRIVPSFLKKAFIEKVMEKVIGS